MSDKADHTKRDLVWGSGDTRGEIQLSNCTAKVLDKLHMSSMLEVTPL